VGAQPTFADAAREWLRYVEVDRRRRPSTLRHYRHVVERALVPAFGALGLRDVTAERIDSYRNALVEEARLAPRSINKYLLVLQAIFRRAQRQWGLTVNPAAGVEREPVRRSGDFSVLSPEQVSALVRTTVAGAHHPPAKREVTAAPSCRPDG
jgi:site-specific recombinase XerD